MDLSFTAKEKLKGIFVVPLAITIVLVPFSLLIGWNLATLFLFWFVMIPIMALYLPRRISKNKDHLLESVAGVIIFYSLMVFMIYKQYQTDYFKVMIASLIFNLILVTLASRVDELNERLTKGN